MLPTFKYRSDVLTARILDLSACTEGGAQKNNGSESHDLLCAGDGLLFCLSGRDLLFELLVGKIVVTDPRTAHLINGPLAVSNRVVRIGIEFVIRRVVVPRDQMQDGPGRQQWLVVFGIKINKMPGELLLTNTTQRFHFVPARVNGFHARGFTAVVQVRLE